jgi:decaprenyl-phosphate phosphoribosyltransferase
VLSALWQTFRPRQWVKNVLVAAAPLAAGGFTTRSVLIGTCVAFICFCLMASSVYCFNDVIDANADRAHPVKRNRPVAAGRLSATAALVCAGVLALASVTLALLTHAHQLWIVLVVYLVTSVAYALWLKHEQVVELALVSSGFLLRAIAGGVAAALPLSRWFLIVASFGSLLIVAGKRLSELLLVGDGNNGSRKILSSYSPTFLRMLLALSASVASAAYCLWAFEISALHGGQLWPVVSVAPFVVGLLRYLLDADAGRAEQPELIVYSDRMLQLLGAVWLVAFAIGAVRA